VIHPQHPRNAHERQRLALSGALSALLLAACSHGASAASGGQLPYGMDADGDWLSFYQDQTGIAVVGAHGENMELENYKTYLAHCKVAPVKPLDPADEAKVGTVRIQHWQDGDRGTATLVEKFGYDWGTGSTPNCVFTPSHSAELKLYLRKQNRSYDIDLVKHTGTVQTLPPSSPSDHLHSPPPDWNQLAMAGIHKLGTSGDAGQPCVILQDPTGNQACVWSGGTKWGYGVADADTPRLWATGSPSVKSDVKTLTTNSFVVGKLKDTRVFDLPSNVSIQDQGGP
jgi:hypothetical protein